MPRDPSGEYTLPAGNPVVPGTIISTTWANPTMDDLGVAMTDSLSRTGNGNMSVQLKIINGTISNPGIGFINEVTLGFYRPSAGFMGVALNSTQIGVWDANGYNGDIGNTTPAAGTFVDLNDSAISAEGEVLTSESGVPVWKEAGAAGGAGPTFPVAPKDGEPFFNTTLERQYTFDETAGAWIDTTSAGVNAGAVDPAINGFRLTLTSGVPVTTNDVDAVGTIYMTPYIGNQISLYNGSNWEAFTLAELSIAAGGVPNLPVDLFLNYNSGNPVINSQAWLNDTTRDIALGRQDGVYVHGSFPDQRYLGTYRTKTAAQVSDSLEFRHLWNYYNRVARAMSRVEPTVNWVYDGTALRQANANALNQLDFVIGVSEDMVEMYVNHTGQNSLVGNTMTTGIGLDSTTALATGLQLLPYLNSQVIGQPIVVTASLKQTIVEGRHFAAWLERGAGVGTQTWNGTANTLYFQSGMNGSIWA